MPRRLLPLLLLLTTLIAPASAHAAIGAVAPANGAVVQMTYTGPSHIASVTFSISEPTFGDMTINRTGAVDAKGALVDDRAAYGYNLITGGTGWESFTQPGDYYWQAKISRCNSVDYVITCVEERTEVRKFTLVPVAPKVYPPPVLQTPAPGARLVAGTEVQFKATDTNASEMQGAIRTQSGDAVEFLSDDEDTWTPGAAGAYTWEMQRTECWSSMVYDQKTPIDCLGQAATPRRPFTVVYPKPAVTGKTTRATYRKSIPVDYSCRPGPCSLDITVRNRGQVVARARGLDSAKSGSGTLWLSLKGAAGRSLRRHLAKDSGRRANLSATVTGTDRYGQKLPRARGTIRLIAAHSPARTKPLSREQRGAVAAVRKSISRRYTIELDKTEASCRSLGEGRYVCTWNTATIAPAGKPCIYRGQADVTRIGTYWDVSLYDFSETCF